MSNSFMKMKRKENSVSWVWIDSGEGLYFFCYVYFKQGLKLSKQVRALLGESLFGCQANQ